MADLGPPNAPGDATAPPPGDAGQDVVFLDPQPNPGGPNPTAPQASAAGGLSVGGAGATAAAATSTGPKTLADCKTAEETAEWMMAEFTRTGGIPSGGVGSRAEDHLKSILSSLMAILPSLERPTAFDYQGVETPVRLREKIVSLLDPQFAADNGLKIPRTMLEREKAEDFSFQLKNIEERKKLLQAEYDRANEFMYEVRNEIFELDTEEDSPEKAAKMEVLRKTLAEREARANAAKAAFESLDLHEELDVAALDFATRLIQSVDDPEEKKDAAAKMLTFFCAHQLAYVAFTVGAIFAIRGPKRTRSASTGANINNKTLRMAAKGQAVLRAACSIESDTLRLVGFATGTTVSINSLMGMVPEMLLSAGLDQQGHQLAKLPLKDPRESIATKLLSVLHLCNQAHSQGDIDSLKRKLIESLRVSSLELSSSHRFPMGLSVGSLNQKLRFTINTPSAIADDVVKQIDLAGDSNEQIRRLKEKYN